MLLPCTCAGQPLDINTTQDNLYVWRFIDCLTWWFIQKVLISLNFTLQPIIQFSRKTHHALFAFFHMNLSFLHINPYYLFLWSYKNEKKTWLGLWHIVVACVSKIVWWWWWHNLHLYLFYLLIIVSLSSLAK